MIIAQVSIAPVGVGVSLSKYVKKALKVFEDLNVSVSTNAMATVIECEDMETLFHAIQTAHNAVIDAGAQRVITEIKIDDRRDKNATVAGKLASIN